MPFERKLINLGNKPKYFTNLYASFYPDPAAKPQVPVIIGALVCGPQNFNARLFALLGAESQAAAQRAKLKIDAGLKVIDAFICQHGSSEGGDYFLEEYSFAEVATTPFLHRGAVARSAHRGYDVQKAVQIMKLQRFGAWMQAALPRPSYIQTKPEEASIPDGYANDVGKWAGHVEQ